MAEGDLADLASLDRLVARGAAALAAWRSGLARDPEAEAESDPLEGVRVVAGRSTWLALAELKPSALDVPLRDALREWVLAFTVARVGRDEEVAEARAKHETRGLYRGDEPGRVSWRQAWRGVAAARTPNEARLWLDAATEAGPAVADAARQRAAKRAEATRRLGLDHPWTAIVATPPAALHEAASRLLDATEDLAKAVWRDSPRSAESPAARLVEAVGRDAGEGWPAQITRRWLEETFAPAVGGLTSLALPALPATLGASSFARAMGAFGYALRVASIPRATPFALGREPGARDEHRLAFVVASLPAKQEWQSRVLGVGKRAAAAQARAMARTALLDTRLAALRILLGDDLVGAAPDAFAHLTERLLGHALDRRLCGAWPAARGDEPARFVARLEAREVSASLQERFETDWFRDPRAWGSLRREAGSAARDAVDGEALERRAGALAGAFEEALG